MKIKNLTPHKITILNSDGSLVVCEIEPSGIIARVDSKKEAIDIEDGIIFWQATFGEVKDLPEFQQDTYLIVSRLVANAVPERQDVWSPGELVRDDQGRPIGCLGLSK